MSEHEFEIPLEYRPKTGKWAEPPPGPCDLGHPPTDVLVCWGPCRCGGHRYYRCGRDEHPDEDSRNYGYVPPLERGCQVGSRIVAPDAGLPGH